MLFIFLPPSEENIAILKNIAEIKGFHDVCKLTSSSNRLCVQSKLGQIFDF